MYWLLFNEHKVLSHHKDSSTKIVNSGHLTILAPEMQLGDLERNPLIPVGE
jgi:hypothetical protein